MLTQFFAQFKLSICIFQIQVAKPNLSSVFFSKICKASLSIKSWLFGNCYLFLKIWSFNNLESNVNLIEPSFILPITIGLIKQSSSHFSSFIKRPSVSILLNSSLTPASKCKGTLLAFA